MATKRGSTQAAGKAKSKRRASVRSASRRLARGEELGAEPRALLGRDEDARAVRPRKVDASVEDPLGDWPED
ncbi:MAG TPA: hypothetical protein VF876_06955 [Burkholderiales bacterium]